jgi:hypothetical protein
MSKSAKIKAVFKGLARMQREYTLEVGPLRATGVAAFLSRSARRLPETLSEAKGLAQTLRGDRPRLNP